MKGPSPLTTNRTDGQSSKSSCRRAKYQGAGGRSQLHSYKYTTIGHSRQIFCNPISEAKFERAISYVPMQAGDRIIDIGAGKCELAIRFVERYGVEATAIDVNPEFAEQAARSAAGRIHPRNLKIVVADASDAVKALTPGFALAICIGSTHALGGLEPTLAVMRQLVKPGGHVLVADCYWKRRPNPEYLAALGDDESIYLDLQGNSDLLVRNGFTPLWMVAASEDEWDQYEGLNAMSIENYCAEHRDDPDCEALLQRARSWRTLRLKWGRDTLGFSLHLARLDD